METTGITLLGAPAPVRDDEADAPEALDAGAAALAMATILATLTGRERVGADQHFFDDLGADSMTMAHFCAKVRKVEGMAPLAMRDVYAHPSIALLAAALCPETPGPAVAPVPVAPAAPAHRATSAAYVLTALAQLAFFTAYAYLGLLVAVPAYGWVGSASGDVEIYLRAVVVTGSLFLGVSVLPVLAKWLLIGRWREGEIDLWSPAYLRFWIVKSLLHANPILLFAGNPIFVLYLRALGARIGPGVTILSRSVPVATDLLTIGAGTVVRKECFYLGYRARAGRIEIGPVTIGADALIGEKTVLDIGAELGDGTQLGHASSLHSGQRVPDGEHWHGSPAVPTQVDYQRVPALAPRPARRLGFALGSLAQTLLVGLPLTTAAVYVLVAHVPSLAAFGSSSRGLATLAVEAAVLAAVAFVGFVIGAAVLVLALPRLLGAIVRPDVTYPLYGVHYSAHRAVTALTNRRLFTWFFGDSSFITGYLSRLGYDLGRVEQTGSNFGTEVQHETPYLVTVGPGTMVADGLSLVNADFSATSFRTSRVELPGSSFLGNNLVYPSGARIGEDCLLATKVMVPLDGPVRSGVGLLGSPAFEIPRTVERDTRFDHLRSGEPLRAALTSKNRYNARSMALMVGLRLVHVFLLSLLGLALLEQHQPGLLGQLLLATYAPLALAVTAGFWVLVERALCRFGSLESQLCSIYDPYFWWHERLWKVPDLYLATLNGTPFKSLVWRLLGVRVGARVFDDGATLTERTLSSLGDDACLNVHSKLQAHSQEDGTFKSGAISIGAGATLGVAAFIHYGTTIGAGCEVEADAFVMKGEQLDEGSRWSGNPAAPSDAR